MSTTDCSMENHADCTQDQITDCQCKMLTLARGITSGACCLIWVIVLLALLIHAKHYYKRACGTVVKRLTFGLTVSTTLLQMFLTLNLVHLTCTRSNNCCSADTFCMADGFLIYYFQSLQLLFILEICTVLLFKVLGATPCCKSIRKNIKVWKSPLCDCKTIHKKTEGSTSICCSHKLEVAVYAATVVLPFIIGLIPFISTIKCSYGSVGPWCGLKGHWDTGLRDAPYILVALLIMMLFTTWLCLLCWALKHGKVQKLIKTAGVMDSLPFLVFLGLMFLLCITEEGLHFAADDKCTLFSLWMTYAIVYPLSATLIPLALLMAVHKPVLSIIACARCKDPPQTDTRSEIETFHESSRVSQPSNTTFVVRHSSLGSFTSQTASYSSYLESRKFSGEMRNYELHVKLPKIEEEKDTSTGL